MDAKKISFGFSKLTKKPNILPSKAPKEQPKVELIKCLEGKEIKLVAEKEEVAPLVIQMITNQKTSTALASLMKRRAVLLGEEEPDPEESNEAPQSVAEVTGLNDPTNLDERAVRELLAAAQANDSETTDGTKLVLPALKADELPLDGAKEATLDDYESIPIQQFGLAMLRGMGWVDPPPAKKKAGAPVDEAPFLRPKGMGLGADKALKAKNLLVQPEKNEILEIRKQAYVRILGGKQKDQYGQIEGFDDHAGRVIVKMAIGGAKEAFNEFLCLPVSKKEYSQFGKCINTAKYEEYKKQENEHGQIINKEEKSKESRDRDRQRDDERRSYRKDEDRRTDNRDYKEERSKYTREDSKPYKTERREFKEERTNSEDSKPYKTERRELKEERADREYKYEERRAERKEHREERNAYKYEDRHINRTESRRRDDVSYDDNRSSGSRYNDRREDTPSAKSSSRRRQQSSSDEADDTGESTESDSDSAYERKKKKSSSRNSKSKKKSKKSKSKTHRSRQTSNSSDDNESSSDERSRRRHPSKHNKKKTKKSKHARSRTRSRSREGRGR